MSRTSHEMMTTTTAFSGIDLACRTRRRRKSTAKLALWDANFKCPKSSAKTPLFARQQRHAIVEDDVRRESGRTTRRRRRQSPQAASPAKFENWPGYRVAALGSGLSHAQTVMPLSVDLHTHCPPPPGRCRRSRGAPVDAVQASKGDRHHIHRQGHVRIRQARGDGCESQLSLCYLG